MTYEIVNSNEKIKEIVGKNQIITVAGGFFGDEAKGKMTDSLSKYCEGIARVNSGENAGHTVYYNGKPLIFHLIPSGITTKKKCFIGDNCVLDPVSMMEKEIIQLNKINFNYSNLIIGNPFIVCPWHKLIDIMRNPNASTGKGMSAIHQDLAAKRFAKLEDFKLKRIRQAGIRKSFNYWMLVLKNSGHNPTSMLEALQENEKIPNHIIKFLENSKLSPERGLKYVCDLYEKTIKDENFPEIGNPKFEMLKMIQSNKKILLEGPQSFYLSNSEGTHPSSTTSAHTHSNGILAASGLPIRAGVTQIVVTKIPSSRVGSGANPGGYVEQDWFAKRYLTKEKLKEIPLNFDHVYKAFIEAINEEGIFENQVYLNEKKLPIKIMNDDEFENEEELKINEALAIVSCLELAEFGATTGKPRVCGSLDLLHLKNQVNYDSNYVCISCIDRLDGLSKVPVITGYKFMGETTFSKGKTFNKGDTISLDDFLPDENILKNCIPIYKVLNGWKNSKNLTTKDKLDKNLENFIEFIEENTGAEIISFGNGPKTDELVFLNKKK